MSKLLTYSNLIKFDEFEDRFKYLKLDGRVGVETFGFDRHINQLFYKSPEWLSARNKVVARDLGCDLGLIGYEIPGKVLVHHMNPLSIEDLVNRQPEIFDPEYLVCVSVQTHNAIHFGDESILMQEPVIRRPGDTTLW